MRTATQKITGPLNIQGLERAQKVVDLSFSCLMRIEKLGMVPKILSCLNISKPQANTIGHTLFTHWIIIMYLQDYDFWTVRCSNGKTNVLGIRDSLKQKREPL